MPKLESLTGGRAQFVADDDPRWQSMVDSGQWRVADGQDVSIVDEYGHQTVAATEALARDRAAGVGGTVEAQDTVTRRAREKRLEDKTSTAGTFLRAGARGVSFGLSDEFVDEETLEADELHHSTANLAGEVLGVGATLFLGNDLGAAKLAGRLFGGSTAAKVSAGARELAITDAAIDAENVGSALSSNALLAGKAEATVGERALARTGRALDEATITRNGLQNVPDDLVGLDANGLKRAAAEERAALKAQADLERKSLEELRVPKREELANQILELHAELQADRAVHLAVKGGDVEKIAGVKDIQVQLAKSFGAMRRGADSKLSVVRDPGSMLKPLEMRQVALEALQEKAPELRTVLGSDARANSLLHVDDALAQTRQQIAEIQALSYRNPVKGTRLAELEQGVSPRLVAIEAAQEALKNAPEVGLMEKGAKAGLLAGASMLARHIPGVGMVAPYVGKWVSEGVGRTFEHLAAAKAAVGNRSKQALAAFLDASSKPGRLPLAAARTATQVLASARFAEAEQPAGKGLAGAFRARSAEIRSQTMYDATGQVVIRPEARQAIAKRLAPIGEVNPILADQLETIAVRKAEFISSKLPRQPDVGGLQIGPDNWKPSELEMRAWARTVRAVEDPGGVEERLAAGLITPEDAEAYRAVYPERFAAMQRAIFEAAPTLAKTLPLQRKIALSIFTGVPLIPALQPNVLQVLQGNYVVEEGTAGGSQAPAPRPSFGALGSLKSSDKPTAAQAREGTV